MNDTSVTLVLRALHRGVPEMTVKAMAVVMIVLCLRLLLRLIEPCRRRCQERVLAVLLSRGTHATYLLQGENTGQLFVAREPEEIFAVAACSAPARSPSAARCGTSHVNTDVSVLHAMSWGWAPPASVLRQANAILEPSGLTAKEDASAPACFPGQSDCQLNMISKAAYGADA